MENGTVKVSELSNQTSGDAGAGDILEGKTAWVNGRQVLGTMEDYSNQTVTASKVSNDESTITLTIPKSGYYSTSSKIQTSSDVDDNTGLPKKIGAKYPLVFVYSNAHCYGVSYNRCDCFDSNVGLSVPFDGMWATKSDLSDKKKLTRNDTIILYGVRTVESNLIDYYCRIRPNNNQNYMYYAGNIE